MNKRVLSAAELKARFKNYGLGVVLSGIALGSADRCSSKNGGPESAEEIKKKLETAEQEKKDANTNLTTVFTKIKTKAGVSKDVTIDNYETILNGISSEPNTTALDTLITEVKSLRTLNGVNFEEVTNADKLKEKIKQLDAKIVPNTATDIEKLAALLGLNDDTIKTEEAIFKAWAKKHGLDEKNVTTLDTFNAEYKAMLAKIATKFAEEGVDNASFVNTTDLAKLLALDKKTSTTEADVYKAVGNALKLKKDGSAIAVANEQSDIATSDDLKTVLLGLVNKVVAVTGGSNASELNEFSTKIAGLQTALTSLKTLVTDEVEYQSAVITVPASAATVKKKGANDVSNLTNLEAAIKSIGNALEAFLAAPNATTSLGTGDGKLGLTQIQNVIAQLQSLDTSKTAAEIKVNAYKDVNQVFKFIDKKANGTDNSNIDWSIFSKALLDKIESIIAAPGTGIAIIADTEEVALGNDGGTNYLSGAFKPCTDSATNLTGFGKSGSALLDELTKKTSMFVFDLKVGTAVTNNASEKFVANGDITAKYDSAIGKITVIGKVNAA